jgi:hypothetical protein
MARVNVANKSDPVFTHEGAPAAAGLTFDQQLRRSVLSCLLWEDEFYEDGTAIAQRIIENANKVGLATLAALAVESRSKFNLRHVPLVLLSVLAQRGKGSAIVADTIASTVQRADELAEFLAVHQKLTGAKRPRLTHQIRKGLARAFKAFDAYQLGKYNRDNAIKLRDVLRLVHPKPANDDQSALWKALNEGTLAPPDTWEVALSGGADKKETFERLIREGNLGYLALLRNLRNMVQAKVDTALIREAIIARKNGAHRVLPFRFVAAARACPQLEPEIDQALIACIADLPRLPRKTVVLVDVSGSMDGKMSGKSDLTRMDAAASLASVINGDLRVFTFSEHIVEVPPRRGMSGVDAVIRSQHHSGTYLGAAVAKIMQTVEYDRMIVISDEQSHDTVPMVIGKRHYMINVASYQNGVGYGPWVHIDGFSEQVIRFVVEHERAAA